MQTATYPKPVSQEIPKARKSFLPGIKDNSALKPNVFIYRKKRSVVVTIFIEQPIYKIAVNLKTDYLRITWRNKSDLQIIYSKNIKIKIDKYQDPQVMWQFNNNTLLINLSENVASRNQLIKSSN